MSALTLLTYLAVLVYIITMISKVLRIKNMPIHLRWELYPVPHEKGRAHYGGSKLEEPEWWTKEHPKDHVNEIKEMGAEIIALKAVWEHNKPLWIGTFPFHIGLYMLAANMLLLVIAGIFINSGSSIEPAAGSLEAILYYKVYYIALIAAVLGAFGSLRLMFSRIVDMGLRNHSSMSHYFNIFLIGSMCVTLLFWILTDVNFVENIAGFYAGLISFGAIPELPTIAYWHIGSTLFFIAYLPFTHMTHMVLKYFSYHSVRWEDEDIKPGSKKGQQLADQLNYKVSWSAKHIDSDGSKSWSDVVSKLPEEM